MSDHYLDDNYADATAIIKQAEYRCPKHGYIAGSFWEIGCHDEKLPGWNFNKKYCFFCMADILAKHCHEIEPIEED